MPIEFNDSRNGKGQPTIIAERDVIETLADGRSVLRARAGQPLLVSEAQRLGLIPSAQPERTPTERKRRAPAEAPATEPEQPKE